MTALLKYDAACRAIAEAKTVDEVTAWIDKAAAVREYGRRIKNRQMEIDAMEIRVKAKRRRGELIRDLKEQDKVREGRKKRSPTDDRLTLEDLGVSKNESSEEQAIANLDGDSFQRLMTRCRAYAEAHPEKHSYNVLKPPPENGPINGARALMGSRNEPDDSLDYFPTPPWATRALMEKVWPIAVPSGRRGTIWEPACGEGHIAEVLREYFEAVSATDIHEYGYGDKTLDFLGEDAARFGRPDWIITNPPFGDSLKFALRAIELARTGVAFFVRQQWLEGVDRYEDLFYAHPPSLIAQFVERVPLCKGRWEPKGTTATAYCWIIWMPTRQQAHGLTEFFWIPPGCRASLTHADDAERFTANPVVKAPRDSTGETISHDTETGEVIEQEQAAPSSPPVKPADDDLDIPAFLRRPFPEARA